MAHDILDLPLSGSPSGTLRRLRVHRFGNRGRRPLVYIQGGLHGDEIPGMLVAERLVRRLAALDATGRVCGEIRVVPVANPLALDQRVLDVPIGRHDLSGQGNFNRRYPELTDRIAGRIGGVLGLDVDSNVAAIRHAALAVAADLRPATAADHLRHTLLAQAIDADIVLDLHCDEAAPVHVYLGTPLWPDARDLVADLGAAHVFLADVSGGYPFDEACSALWWHLADLFGDRFPIPSACLAATVELRGLADVDGPMADADADAIVRFLTRRGAVTGTPPPTPQWRGTVTPLAGVEMVTATTAGIVLHRRTLGDRVAAGDVVAEVIDPAGADRPGAAAPASVLVAAAAGPIWAQTTRRFVHPGDVVAKIAGVSALPGKGGDLLTQ